MAPPFVSSRSERTEDRLIVDFRAQDGAISRIHDHFGSII